jgi:hypothetical protein
MAAICAEGGREDPLGEAVMTMKGAASIAGLAVPAVVAD